MSGIYLRAEMGNGDLVYYTAWMGDSPSWTRGYIKDGHAGPNLYRVKNGISLYRAIMQLCSMRRLVKCVCFRQHHFTDGWLFLYGFNGFDRLCAESTTQDMDWSVFEGNVLKHTGTRENCIEYIQKMPMPPERYGITLRQVGPAHKVAREVVVTVEEPT